jgi:hypothetical protein
MFIGLMVIIVLVVGVEMWLEWREFKRKFK